MKIISSKNPVLALMMGITLSSFAYGADQTVAATDGNEDQTMSVKMETYTPSHPSCTPTVRPAPIVEAAAPAPVAVAAPEADSDGDGVVDSSDKCPDTPHGYKVDPTGCPVHVTLHLHFAFDSSVIPASDYPEVEKLSKIMKENPAAKAVIVGHTDATGTDAYNQGLSERRAQSLSKKLQENGIEADRIQASGKGEKEPIATNSTRAGRTDNRRIEVELQ